MWYLNIKGAYVIKVLYIGVYRDGTGWARAALDYILSLHAAGVDVVPRPLKLNNDRFPIPDRVVELEKKSSEGCDVVIQHILPHMMEYDGRFRKNIGLFASETSNFRSSGWAERLNLMDEVWVINHQQFTACKYSGVTRRLSVVPHATDITKFQRSYEPIPELQKNLEDSFAFYFVGELNARKNLAALLKAFHLEFRVGEPVSLVLKVNGAGKQPQEVAKQVHDLTTEIKTGLKLYSNIGDYHKEHVLPGRLSDEAIMRLHSTCDCFVMPSHGEAWCIPAFDAMAMGKTPIVTACTGFLDYIDNGGWLVSGVESPVFSVNDTFQDLFTGHETWTEISIPELRSAMRQAFENNELRKFKSEAGMDLAYDFSYEKVGQLMKDQLEL